MSNLKIMFVGLACLVGLVVLIEGLLLLRILAQIKNHKNYWLEQAEKQVPEGALYYVALGDSTAQGIGATSADKGYVGLVADQLKQRTGQPVHIINLSVSGAVTTDVINDQIPKLNNLKLPDSAVITLAIGANEMIRYDHKEFIMNFEKMLQLLPAQTVVADIPYFGSGRHRASEKNVSTANQSIHKLVASYGFKLAPLHEITQTRDSFGVHSADWFHPSNKGYRNWQAAFSKSLENSSLLY